MSIELLCKAIAEVWLSATLAIECGSAWRVRVLVDERAVLFAASPSLERALRSIASHVEQQGGFGPAVVALRVVLAGGGL